MARREDLNTRLRDAKAEAAQLVEDASAEILRLDEWRSSSQTELLSLLRAGDLNLSSTCPEEPLQHARTLPPSFADRLRAVNALSTRHTASQSTLSQELAPLKSEETLESVSHAVAELRAELSSARQRVESFSSVLSHAESDAAAWPEACAKELEDRREREAERHWIAEEQQRADWSRRALELNARLFKLQKTLDSFETYLAGFEALLTPGDNCEDTG